MIVSSAGGLRVLSAPAQRIRGQALVPGLALALAVALAARGAAVFLPSTVSEVLVAVVLGLVIANLWGLPASVQPGLRFTQQRVLRLGIILLGARLSLFDVAAIGVPAFGLVVVCMAVAFTGTALLARRLRLPPRLAILIGVGTAVCGNTAIIATAPVIRAEEREVSFAVATITLFGTLAIFLYPLIGHMLQLSAPVFGVWSGVAVNDTSQVVATSAVYSAESRDIATVVKLVRNTLMAPLILLLAWWSARGLMGAEATRRSALKAFPLFVLGFLLMALVRTLGLIDDGTARSIDLGATFCILLALAAVGLSTKLGEMQRVGPTPFLLGFGTATLLAVASLLLIVGLGIAPTGG
jgi:uncharacterized integral membrane protein (TIGR00698 family)